MGLLKYSLGILILSFCTSVLPVHAETYEPGRGILLPKRNQDKPIDISPNKDQTIMKVKRNQSGPAIIDKGILAPQGRGPLVVQLSQKTDGTAQKLTSAYASHVYSSFCSQEYRDRMVTKTEKNINRKKMMGDIQASCKCLANEILSVVPAGDLADYVMYNYGDQSTEDSPESAAYFSSPKSDRISQLSLNAQARAKCGFLK